MDSNQKFSIEELRTLVKGVIGREIVFFESVDSTNRLAMELAEKGASHGTVVIAESQTKGKGRLGRTWLSPQGNIYMSVILKPEIEPKAATLLTIMAAIVCANAITQATGLQAKIKWPNDLIVSGKKLGGILTEMKSDPDKIVFAVIGIGINVNMKSNSFPPDIRPFATSIAEELGTSSVASRNDRSRTLIVAKIFEEMEKWHEILKRGGKNLLLEEWRRLSSTLGRKIKATSGMDTFTGIAEDINDEGMLLLRLSSGELKKISAGDVTL